MSIIENTLRNLQEKKDNEDLHLDVPETQVVEEASMNIKPARGRAFVVISIVLTLLGLGAYYGLEKYQENLNNKSESLAYNFDLLESLTVPVDVSTKEVTPHKNTGVVDTNQETQVTSVNETLQVKQDHKEAVTENKTPKVSTRDNTITELTVGPPLSDKQGIKLPERDISKDNVSSVGDMGVDESNHDIRVTTIAEETSFKQKFGSEELHRGVSQPENIKVSPEFVKYLTQPREKQTTILEEHVKETRIKQESDSEVLPHVVPQAEDIKVSSEFVEYLAQSETQAEKKLTTILEEHVVVKQLKRARHLINIGSYAEAIDLLKPIIDRKEEIWDTYLLMGAAYVGLDELDYAEEYLRNGLAINGNVPQLWLQYAIIEQQRGRHEAALRILNGPERLAPDIPEVQLNIGYSYDAIGNQKLSIKAYNSFLKLTEGNSAYIMVRHKVLERLHNLK